MEIGGVFQGDSQIEYSSIEDLEAQAAHLLLTMFPDDIENLDALDSDAAEEAMSRWESVFAITPAGGASMSDRSADVIGKIRAVGGLNKSYFESLAEGLGYTIGLPAVGDPHLRIVDGEYGGFRADYGQADITTIYDQEAGDGLDNYTWTVYGTDVESATSLQRLFNNLKPEGTTVVFTDE